MFETLPSGQPYLPPSQRRRDFPPPSAWMVWRGSASLGQPCASTLRRVVPENNFFPFRERGKAKMFPASLRHIFFYDCEPRTVVRVRIRGIVVRIRVNETAIRIRTVVRPQHHTRAMPASAFLLSLPPLGWRAASISSVVHHYIYIYVKTLIPSGQPMADNALYALTLAAFTISPLKASREPEFELVNEES